MPKYVIGDKVYDTEKAEVIAENATLFADSFFSGILGKNVTLSKFGTIYRTKKGVYFFQSGTRARKLEEEQVKEYLKYHNYQKYAELFGELEEA